MFRSNLRYFHLLRFDNDITEYHKKVALDPSMVFRKEEKCQRIKSLSSLEKPRAQCYLRLSESKEGWTGRPETIMGIEHCSQLTK
jgi:hypothetical protein